MHAFTLNANDSSPHSGYSNIDWTAITGPSNDIGFRLTYQNGGKCTISDIILIQRINHIYEDLQNLTSNDFMDLLLDIAFKISPSPLGPIRLADKFKLIMTSLIAVAAAISSDP
jgi:hypothetical protein